MVRFRRRYGLRAMNKEAPGRGPSQRVIVVVFVVVVLLVVGYFALGMPGMDHQGHSSSEGGMGTFRPIAMSRIAGEALAEQGDRTVDDLDGSMEAWAAGRALSLPLKSGAAESLALGRSS